jgi:hypothetical protein
MLIAAFVGLFSLIAALFVIHGLRAFNKERRYLAGCLHLLLGLCFLLAGAAAGFLGSTLASYHRLDQEQHAADIQFVRKGDRLFTAKITYPSADVSPQTFELRGDEWQVDARVIKWRGLANLLGFDTLYRLERVGGRYTTIEDERNRPRTVYALNPPDRFDTWDLARRAKEWLPWVDALYGSAVFLPMADGALFEVRVSHSGLVARARNEEAHKAVGGWTQNLTPAASPVTPIAIR